MKLHDLKPAAGSRKERTRVGRGISAGKGKTAGRGTKGQKSRAGASIPAWFEGGQTPAHVRLPKLHGFKRRFRIEYQVVNVGRIAEYAVAGRFGAESGDSPLTVNNEVLRAAGLISTERLPVKVLGHGDVEVKLFVAAEAFTKSAREKIEAAGGFVQATAPVIVKGETKQDRADARAAVERERQQAADAASAARWADAAATSPAAQPLSASAASATAEAPVADPDVDLERADDSEGDADADVSDEAEATTSAAADDGDQPAVPDEEPAAEDTDEAPTSRRRSGKSTDSSDQ